MSRFMIFVALTIFLLLNSLVHAQTTNLDLLHSSMWQWIELTDPNQKLSIEKPEQYVLEFTKEGVVQIKADCNRARGSYTTDDQGKMSIKIGPVTRAMCPPKSHSDDFLKKLGFVSNFFIKDGELYMDMSADGGTFHFKPAPSKSNVVHYSCEDGTTLVVLFKSGDPPTAELQISYAKQTLSLSPSASGSKYVEGTTTFWSKGDEAIFERDGKSITCKNAK